MVRSIIVIGENMNTIVVGEKIVTPSKIVCVGRNYVEHIAELDNEVPSQMVLFNKPNSAIGTVLLANHQEPLHYEAELCFVVNAGRYTHVGVGLDLTKRTTQSQLKEKGLPWERAKAFDGSALFSEFVPIASIDMQKLLFMLFIDDVLVQQGSAKLMINSPQAILEEISSYTTLTDGDVVMTGTPKGVGKISINSWFRVKLVAEENTLIEQSWKAK